MHLLAYDGILASGLRKFWSLILLNVCFLICCIPIVTIGAAATAMYSVFLNPRDDGPLKHFFLALKDNFKQSTAMWLVFLAVDLLTAVSCILSCLGSFPGYQFIRIITVVFAGLLCSIQIYAFALQARYVNSTGQTLRNALVLGCMGIIPGFLMTVIFLIPVIVFFLNINAFIYVFAIWLWMGYSASSWINAAILKKVFLHIQPEELI